MTVRPGTIVSIVPREVRFWSQVDRRGPDECWPWLAYLGADGYGRFRVNSRRADPRYRAPAHRFAYELIVGPIPAGMTIDHLCRNRACCNPAHLEPVSNAENVMRGVGPCVVNAGRTHCVNGHPFDEVNTRYSTGPSGNRRRACRACGREWMRRYRAEEPEQADGFTASKAREFVEWRGTEVEVV